MPYADACAEGTRYTVNHNLSATIRSIFLKENFGCSQITFDSSKSIDEEFRFLFFMFLLAAFDRSEMAKIAGRSSQTSGHEQALHS